MTEDMGCTRVVVVGGKESSAPDACWTVLRVTTPQQGTSYMQTPYGEVQHVLSGLEMDGAGGVGEGTSLKPER